MSIVVNALLICALLGYAGWIICRAVQKSKKGQCSGCSGKDGCQSDCCSHSS